MQKKRILIVEDEESLLKLETILLTVKGYAVSGVTTGKEALERLSDERFDLVLLDLMLPDIDGIEICRQIKVNPHTAKIPVVILTARKSFEDKEDGVSGADAYLTKPFQSVKIIEAIEDLLSCDQSVTS